MRTEQQREDVGADPVCDRARVARAMICEEVARILRARYGKALRAVVLTGSVARDEGTFIKNGDGWRVLGDAEFFLVFQDRAPLPTPEAVKAIAREVSNILAQRGLLVSVGFSPVNGSYFKHLPRHILTYELRGCGSVVWGDAGVLALIPTFTPEQISLEDAWRLLGNRIIEQLESLVAASPSAGGDSQDIRYRTAKLYLDMATSYLVFAGRYRPTYREREQALRDLAGGESVESESPFPLASFAQRVSDCTRVKLGATGLESITREFRQDSVRFAHLLWRWELIRLTGEASELSDADLMFRWMSQQPLRAKIRGWVSVLRRSGWIQSWRDWFRWVRLGQKASPRYWVYSVATEIYFGLPRQLATDPANSCRPTEWKLLASRLPFSTSPDLQPGARMEPAQVVAFNYHSLLENTVA